MNFISLLHPSRGRAKKSIQTEKLWLSKAGNHKIEIITSVDDDDKEINEYKRLHPKLTISKNKCVVEATNKAAKCASGDILVYLSDDFNCPQNWTDVIISEFKGVNKPLIIKVNDCLQKFRSAFLTIPIMNRTLYEKLGYFWHPEYKSMFVDEDLYWVCKKNNWLKECPGLEFPHEHHSIGKAQNDETYIRSSLNWDQGKTIFERRKREGFPI